MPIGDKSLFSSAATSLLAPSANMGAALCSWRRPKGRKAADARANMVVYAEDVKDCCDTGFYEQMCCLAAGHLQGKR